MYTVFPATAGEETTPPVVAKVHPRFPVAASKAYTRPSSEPKYTLPPATVGEDSTPPPVAKAHTREPVAASRA